MLKRLHADRIDLLYKHRVDLQVSIYARSLELRRFPCRLDALRMRLHTSRHPFLLKVRRNQAVLRVIYNASHLHFPPCLPLSLFPSTHLLHGTVAGRVSQRALRQSSSMRSSHGSCLIKRASTPAARLGKRFGCV